MDSIAIERRRMKLDLVTHCWAVANHKTINGLYTRPLLRQGFVVEGQPDVAGYETRLIGPLAQG